MPGYSPSLRSSLESRDNEGPIPIQLDTSVHPERPSVYQRASSATTAFLLLNSDSTSTEVEEGPKNSTIKNNTRSGIPNESLGQEEYFGADHIHSSLKNTGPGDEEALNDAEIHEFFPGTSQKQVETTEDEPPTEPIRRRESTVTSVFQNISKKLGFWDDEFMSQRITIFVTLLKNYVYLITGFTCALCIYWGAYYNRTPRFKKLKFAVVIADAQVGSLTPVLGRFVSQFFQNPAVRAYGNFDIWNSTRISTMAASNNNSIEQEVLRQVHHQHYLAAFYVHENATAQMYRALASGNTTFNPSSDLLSVFYETGSDYNAMSTAIITIIQNICQSFVTAMRTGPWSLFWMKVLNANQIQRVFSEAPSLLTTLPNFLIVDKLPVVEQVVQAPLQVGLIYLCIFTFFQFLFSAPIHISVARKIKGLRFVAFRIATAQGAYLVLSLSYVVLNRAFGMGFRKTFGNSGFLVIWAISFLTMSSIGSIIEILVFVCIVLKPAMIGVVLLLVAVLNLAPTISPIYLCPDFYRYGYAMPVYNSYHLLQAAYFDSWKGNMGRHFGILVAWSVVTNLAMPFAMKWVSNNIQAVKQAAAAASAANKTKSAKASKRPTAPAGVAGATSAAMVSDAEKIQEQES